VLEEGRIRMGIVGICLTYTANYAKALFDYDLRSMTHCWSLAIEEQYYLAWPLVVVGLERFSKRNGTKFLLLLSCALGAALYRSAMVGTFSPRRIFFALDTHVDGLVMGSALSYLVAEVGSNEARWCWALRSVSSGLVPVAVVGLSVVACFLYWGNPWMGRVGLVLVAAASSVLILDLASVPGSMLRPFLEFSALVYLGRISYGLYLYHYPIYHFVGSRFSDTGFPMRVIVMLVATLLVAAVSYHTLESAFLGLKVCFERSPCRQSGTVAPPA